MGRTIATTPAASPPLKSHEHLVPATPSPLFHPACLPNGGVVPPFDMGGVCMALPPACAEGGEDSCVNMPGFSAPGGMMPMGSIPVMMYDPSSGATFLSGWMPAANFSGTEQPQTPEGGFAEEAGADPANIAESQSRRGKSPQPQQVGMAPRKQDRHGVGDGGANHQAFPEMPSESFGQSLESKVVPQQGLLEEHSQRSKNWGEADSGREPYKTWKNSPSPKTEWNSAESQQTPTARTTVMLRNIPNKYTRDMLVNQLNQNFRGQFDFVYLPIDFKNKCNMGYCFINFRTLDACERFAEQFHGVDANKCLPGMNTRKVTEVTPARVHGLEENVKRLRSSAVMAELIDHPDWMPVVLDEDGQEKPFFSPDLPLPTVKPRPRGRRHEGDRSHDKTSGLFSESGGRWQRQPQRQR